MEDLLARLRRENQNLRDRIQVLEDLVLGQSSVSRIFPVEWRLEPGEARIMRALIRHPIAGKELLLRAAATSYALEDLPDVNIVAVRISRMRPKLLAHDILIHNEWGVGYYLDPMTRERLKEYA